MTEKYIIVKSQQEFDAVLEAREEADEERREEFNSQTDAIRNVCLNTDMTPIVYYIEDYHVRLDPFKGGAPVLAPIVYDLFNGDYGAIHEERYYSFGSYFTEYHEDAKQNYPTGYIASAEYHNEPPTVYGLSGLTHSRVVLITEVESPNKDNETNKEEQNESH